MQVLKLSLALIIFVFGIGLPVQAAAEKLPEKTVLQTWIKDMQENRRGPFKRIRWFCNDGSILPPKAYACREHGGGVQHGEWTDRVKVLRQHNYLIANLLADLSPETFFTNPNWQDQLKQIMLEQYLLEAADGWIFRRARYYRGALQAEDENWHGEALLLGLLEQPKLTDERFLLLREAARLLPHGRHQAPLTEMRQLALEIEALDPKFAPLRIKLHTRPDASDVDTVRQHTATATQEARDKYQRLAELIETVTRPSSRPLELAYQLGISPKPQLPEGINTDELSANIRFARASQLLHQIRSELTRASSNQDKLRWIDLSLDLETELYRSANQLLTQLPQATRRQRLAWIEQGFNALYGSGFLSERQRTSLGDSIKVLLIKPLSSEAYQRELTYLARSSRWAENSLRFNFESTMEHLAALDPAFKTFLQERLRASPLLPISLFLDSLLADSQNLRGIKQTLFDQPETGLQPLNPGLARGRLEIVSDPHQHNFRADGIYLLPETIAELPPVAGILTRGSGNALSHIQLLARNLGIPNLAISERLVPELARHAGEVIIVAISPRGIVQIESDSKTWQERFGKKSRQTDFLITPDLEKLDLQQRDILPLEQIRASDSGRIAGPKGANLGELKQIYNQLVPDALVVPFGIFRDFLDTATTPNGQSLFDWMRKNYRQLEKKSDSGEKNRRTAQFLRQLQQQIKSAPLDPLFLDRLRSAMEKYFGPDRSFGVFVRSDTNVEDLPNFTGAGLNKTVPHVVGFENIVTAIRRVWASPFSERAFSWRQAHMRSPEHVYASVLLMKSVPAEKSGVLATTDLVGGDTKQLHVAVNEGVGGAVSGQRAEEILIDKQSGRVRLLAQASAPQKRILLPEGGIRKVAAEAPEQLLSSSEIEILQQMAELLPKQFPSLRDSNGQIKPADIEFGFLDGNFVLFQIRPLLESKRVKKDLLLRKLDAQIETGSQRVDLQPRPRE